MTIKTLQHLRKVIRREGNVYAIEVRFCVDSTKRIRLDVNGVAGNWRIAQRNLRRSEMAMEVAGLVVDKWEQVK